MAHKPQTFADLALQAEAYLVADLEMLSEWTDLCTSDRLIRTLFGHIRTLWSATATGRSSRRVEPRHLQRRRGGAIMSAEIIPFGEPQSAPVERRRKVRKVREAGERDNDRGPNSRVWPRAPTTSEIREVLDRRRRAERDSEAVRLMFGDQLYEVTFCGNDVQRVDAIQYRIGFDGDIQEMKYRHWHPATTGRDLDPAMEEGAKRVPASGRNA